MGATVQPVDGVRKVSCHCGAVELRVDFSRLVSPPARCNCSLCSRKGAIMIGVPLGALEVVAGAENLTLYQWNTRVAEHYFCKRCGIYTHHRRRRDPNQYGINAGCIEGLDVAGLTDVGLADGASLSVKGGEPARS